jgi:flagellar biosynthesis protein FlhF
MELKRILARDARSANEKAIHTYGPDVLVISTQRIGDQIELIVAVEAAPGQASVPPVTPGSSPSGADLRQEKAEVFAEIFGFVQRQESEQMADREVLLAPTTQSQTSAEPSSLASPVRVEDTQSVAAPESPKAKEQVQRKTQAKTQADAKSKPQAKSKTPAKSKAEIKTKGQPQSPWSDDLQLELVRHLECVDLLRQEVGVLRREMQLQRQVMPWHVHQDLSPEASALADEMARLGVPVGLRALLMEALKTVKGGSSARQALQAVLEAHLSGCVSATIPAGVHALVGPSGSGKTSMVVRMAHAMAQVNGVHSQAIISYADPRPGAWSQIQMLASSAGIDVYRASDSQTLAVLLEELKPRQHIWIDTASHAHFERDPALCQAHPDLFWHAVAPQDASATTLRRMQAQMPWHSLMITKADEGFHVWQWLQAFSEQQLPVSMVSFSDKIQMPARAFDPKAWVQQAIDDLKLAMPSKGRQPKRTLRKVTATSGKAEHA